MEPNTPIRILHLEDDPADASLISATISGEGLSCEIHLVSSRETFLDALNNQSFDLVMSDYNLPSFDGLSALALLKQRHSECPFILLSGSLGEENAIESLKSGATDYVLKHRLSRLVPAIRRALSETQARSERRQLEEQFRQAQKMEAIGRLAGGVAHDLNNMLMVIHGYAEIHSQKVAGQPELLSSVEEIKKAAERAALVVRQLLAFSRKQLLDPRVLNINATVGEVEKMLRHLIGEDIELSLKLTEGLWPVKVDPGQIQQVIMNLAVNARDAMPKGGRLLLETANVELDEAYAAKREVVKPGAYVMLAVSDTGTGMDAVTQQRLFEPFFTTKEVGKGTGLGLATVYGIVKQSGGYIWVYSEQDKGTVFKIYFPRIGEEVRSAPAAKLAAPPVSGHGKTILVVEDEKSVRLLMEAYLGDAGFAVLCAQHGEEALSLLAEQKTPPDLVISDVVMPKLGGVDFYERLQKTRPGLRMLFMSGYTERNLAEGGALKPGTGYLQKPFNMPGLLTKIAEMLEK